MIQILDCTLRDGGYQNDWCFGSQGIRKMVYGLEEAGIDIIECGFVTELATFQEGKSKYPSVEMANKAVSIYGKEHSNSIMRVVMINYGEYKVENLSECTQDSIIKGIRVAFHKKDLEPALNFISGAQKLGYKIFVQAMLSMAYSEREFEELIRRINEIKPYAFYVVDSFGSMKSASLEKYSCLADNLLSSDIKLGFHSHNNLQLAFSNAERFCTLGLAHDLIVDASVHGMGRGAGNLNTELFVDYLNSITPNKYDLRKILEVEDEVITNIYQEKPWGYSLPNYLSAVFNVHPNYASYLSCKNTLTFEDMHAIIGLIDSDKKINYDEEYIETIYLRYMQKNHVSRDDIRRLKEELFEKDVLLVAPGKNSVAEADKVISIYEERKPVVISVNFDYQIVPTDYIFVSNLRRFKEIDAEKLKKTIITSNISNGEAKYRVNYNKLKNEVDAVKDNAGLMAINLLIMAGVREILVAGMDGYSLIREDNYAERELDITTIPALYEALNRGMERVLSEYRKLTQLNFITDSLFK